MKKWLIIPALLTLVACASQKPATNELLSEPGRETLNLNGCYTNFVLNNSPNRYKPSPCLWALLTKQKTLRLFDTTFNLRNSFVEISMPDSRHLVSKLFIDSSLNQTTILKGKVKNGQFVLRPRRYFIPIPFLFFISASYKATVSPVSGGIIVHYSSKNFVWVLLAFGDSSKEAASREFSAH